MLIYPVETQKRSRICNVSQSHMIKLFSGIQAHIFSSSCPFSLPPLKEKGFTLYCLRGEACQNFLIYVSKSNRIRGNRGLGVPRAGTHAPYSLPASKVRSFTGISTSPKIMCPKHSPVAAGSPHERTVQRVSTSKESHVDRYHTSS